VSFFKIIFVPTDFTSRSDVAYRYACEIATETDDEICLLNVVDTPYEFPSRLNEILKQRKEAATKELEAVVNDLKSIDKCKKLHIEQRIETGKIATTILQQIKKRKPGLVIMGTGGEHSIKNLIYGSITNTMLLDSPVPVLGIPGNSDYRSIHSFVFATDLRKRDIKIIKWVYVLASKLNAEFHVIHIDTGTDENNIRKFKKRLTTKVSEKIILEVKTDNSFFEGMTSYLRNQQRLIIVMPRYKKKFIEWLTVRSSAREIAYYGHSPLLMIPA